VPWWYAVAERDHDIQNPTSPEKIRSLGRLLRLGPTSRVLDLACGKAGPALILAREFSCAVTGVERASEFVSAAHERVARSGLEQLVHLVESDAAELELESAAYDVVMCLGASFVWGGLDATLTALTPAARKGGHVVVGEPYWRRWPLPEGIADGGFLPLKQTSDRFAAAGLQLEALIVSSEDDWDRYETLHWRAVEEWLAEHPDDPDADQFRRRHESHRDEYLQWGRELFGWAIFAGRRG
jgi:SAM-dependent methyltransferase